MIWPGSESAKVLLADLLWGANWPGSEKARYLKYISDVRLETAVATYSLSRHADDCVSI